MPNILGRRNRRPLQRQAQRGRGRRDRDPERPDTLTLCAPDRQDHVGTGAVSDLDGEGTCVGFFNRPPVDADDEVVPGFEGYVGVFVAEDLEAEGGGAVPGGLGGGVGVEAGYEAVEGAEHGW